MKLFTVQMGKWRRANDMGQEIYDITVKSGDKRFAPCWSLLKAYQDSDKGIEAENAYREGFRQLMNKSINENFDAWQELCKRDVLVISCYCAAGKFCHRMILVEYLEKVCKLWDIPFEYAGELD